MYEESLDLSDIGEIVNGYPIPPGMKFSEFDRVTRVPFYLKINGPDWWKIERYSLLVSSKRLSRIASQSLIMGGF